VRAAVPADESRPRRVDQAWADRATHDARAATRGDVLPPDASGLARYPRYVDRCSGAHVWDVDGNRYIDYLLGYGPVILGHAHPEITRAAVAELDRGHCFAPLWSPRQVELTERLSEIIPGAESALLLKTGSDATSAAVRLARIATGRDLVVRWGYNGWHDWAVHQEPGVPRASRAIEFDLDDLDGLDRLLVAHTGDVACIVTMPFEYHESPPGHLQALRAIVHRHGALLVLDEMRSGFRLGLGGAQERLDVQADLTTFSKGLANGYTISAVTGSADLLAGLAVTKISSTFFANPADMAAALATLRVLEDTDAIERIWATGSGLISGLREVVAETGVPAEVVGYPPMPFLRFTGDEAAADRARLAFFTETTRRGLLLHPDHQWFTSAAHTEADLDETLEACRAAMTVAAQVA
jgi:glutamate-1-semialdehyde 2,1-aminomutase